MNAYQIWRMCGRKRKFAKHKDAAIAAAGRDMRVYRCAVCGKLHLTHFKIWKGQEVERLEMADGSPLESQGPEILVEA